MLIFQTFSLFQKMYMRNMLKRGRSEYSICGITNITCNPLVEIYLKKSVASATATSILHFFFEPKYKETLV